MRQQSRQNYGPNGKVPLALLSTPIFFAAVLSLQVLWKPINFLFADDWLLVDYIIPEKQIKFTELFQLVNGHNVLTTKLALIFLSDISGDQTLIVFTIFNLLLASVACTLIILKLLVGSAHPYYVVILVTTAFFNYKQVQNYNMIISAHFIHSLLCSSAYLFFKNTEKHQWRWIPLVIAPFTGGFGITILILESYLSGRDYLKTKNKSNLINVIACLSLFMTAYGFNLFFANSSNNNPDHSFVANLFTGLQNPWYLPSFVLSAIGSQFTPSSRYMGIISQIAGALILLLIFKYRGYIKASTYLIGALAVSAGTIILISINAYDGTYDSIRHAYSNRYVSSTLLIAIVVLVAVVNDTKSKLRKFVLMVVVISSCFSGLKSGLEWVNFRHSQSITLEKTCYSDSIIDKKKCSEMSYSESFFKNYPSFEKKLTEFIEVYESK